jgi:hypothetical protein
MHHAMGGELDAFFGVDHHDRGVGGIQGTHGLAHEVRVTRGVQDMDQGVLMIQVGGRQFDGMQMGFFQRVVIANGAATIDATRGGNGSRGGQQCFDERGFSGTAMADERQGPNLV